MNWDWLEGEFVEEDPQILFYGALDRVRFHAFGKKFKTS